MSTLVLTAALLSLIVGVAVYSANPRRPTNQAFGLLSLLLVAIWVLRFFALKAELGELRWWANNPIPWIRINTTINGFLPFALWLLKETVLDRSRPYTSLLLRSVPWLLFGTVLGIICFSDLFISSDSPVSSPKRGIGYLIRTMLLIGALLLLAYDAFSNVRKLKGIKGLEMRFLALNGSLVALASVVLLNASHHLRIPELRGPTIVLVLMGYSIMAWAMTIHKVFNIHQICNSIIQKLITFSIAAAVCYGIHLELDILAGPNLGWYGWIISTLISLLLAIRIDEKIRKWLGTEDDRITAATRQSVLAAMSNSKSAHNILTEFEFILREVSQATQATLITDQKDLRDNANPPFDRSRPGYRALCKLEWATPESVERRRSSPELDDLENLLIQQNLGVLIAAPRGSLSPSLIVAIGPKANGWPFTFPEVRRLQDIADLMDNALTHSRLSAEAAVRSRINDITIISRGLAHDLKNLLTPISSFLVHTDGRFESGSPEAEVHAAATRSIQVMRTYIEESQFVANRLEPRLAKIELEKVLNLVRDAIMPIAAGKEISLTFPDVKGITLNADSVLLQRLLINLISNAVDASPIGHAVTLTILRTSDQWLRIEVRDFGCGIPPDHIARVFDPGYTAKRPDSRQKGFGLGLTITEKIVRIHHGTIKVDSNEGAGTTVSIDLPLVNFQIAENAEKPVSWNELSVGAQ